MVYHPNTEKLDMFSEFTWPLAMNSLEKQIKPDSFHYHVSTSKIIVTAVVSVFENKQECLAYLCFIAPLEYF